MLSRNLAKPKWHLVAIYFKLTHFELRKLVKLTTGVLCYKTFYGNILAIS
jgi:hypothetical protein